MYERSPSLQGSLHWSSMNLWTPTRDRGEESSKIIPYKKIATKMRSSKFETNSELIDFVRKKIREFNMIIDECTQIEKDLGVTGDDAEELIQEFSKVFNVDLSNFLFSQYFNDEPHLFYNGKDKKPLTIGHLEKAIAAGKLDDDIINS